MRDFNFYIFIVPSLDILLRNSFDRCFRFSVFASASGDDGKKGLPFAGTGHRVVLFERGTSAVKLLIPSHVHVSFIFNNPLSYFKSNQQTRSSRVGRIFFNISKFYTYNTHMVQPKLSYNRIHLMIYLKLEDLIAAFALHDFAQHQIKGKRIKKELAFLQEYQNQKLTFKKYQLTAYGISFYIEIQYQHKIYDFEVFIDAEYPFNSPKVYYEHESSPYAGCQDLLDNLLDGGTWGPSLLLNSIFDKLHLLAKYIFEENQNLTVRYHLNQIYQEDILNRYKVELFKVEEYTWKYMMKSTAKKVIGLTKETFLKFTANEGDKLKLQSAIKIKEIKEANASLAAGKFKLDIVSFEQAGKNKYYFCGDQADVQKILYYMNPIQVIERKLSKSRESYKPEELQQTIKQYSDLIEYYSLRDAQKTKTYVNQIQKLIKNNYENGMTPDKKIEKLAEDIKI